MPYQQFTGNMILNCSDGPQIWHPLGNRLGWLENDLKMYGLFVTAYCVTLYDAYNSFCLIVSGDAPKISDIVVCIWLPFLSDQRLKTLKCT